MTQEYLSDIVLVTNNIVGLFVVIRFLNHLLVRRDIKKITRRWGLIALLIGAIAINITFENLESSLVLVLMLNYIIGDLFYQGKRHIKLIAALFIVIFSLITELITAVSFGVLFDVSIQGVRNNAMHLFLGGVVSKILLMLLVEVIIKFRRRNASKVSLGSWLLIILIPIISIVLAVVSVYEPMLNNSIDVTAVLACVSILYINLIAFYLFDSIIFQIDENNQIRHREEQLILQQSQYKNIISGYNQVNKIHHDMLCNLIAIDGYLTNNRIEEAIDYIGKLHNELDFSRQGILSKNIAVDAIINNRKAIANKQGIDITHDIVIPKSIKINDMDVCVVLGNALNNAIEACQRINDKSLNSINLKMRYKKDSLLIEIINPCDIKTIKSRNGKFISSKSYRRKDEIGIGIGNIKAIAEKYNGLCEIDLQSDVFIIKVMIPDKKIDIKS